jgi:hypothetical protein
MRAFIIELDARKKYILLQVYNSNKKSFGQLQIPKYYLDENSDLEIGDEVIISLTKKAKKSKK